MLFISDVLGKRVIETKPAGRVTVREENAAGALEVMSRFAIDPRWLLYLPPTMAPCATSAQPGLLEHPAEAFAAYAADGIAEVICEEKHMGSRAIVLACRDDPPAGAASRFAAAGDQPGAVYTRTGRPFFGPARSGPLLDAVRSAIAAAGLWQELDTSWLLLDCELMPWSVKAERCSGSSTRRSARPPGPRCPRRPGCSAGRRRAGSTWPNWPAGPRPGWPTRPRSAPPTGGTAGRRTGWMGCGWPRSSYWPPNGTRTTSGITAGTWPWPTGWPTRRPR